MERAGAPSGMLMQKNINRKNKTMSTDNRISITVTEEAAAAVRVALNDLKAAFAGITVNLSESDRMSLPKIGDKTLAFDAKCAGYMADRRDLVPGFIEAGELAKDRELIAVLAPLLRELTPLVSDLESTVMLAYSDVYVADLAFYQNVKQASKRGVNGAEAIYDDLRERFPGTRRPSPTPPNP